MAKQKRNEIMEQETKQKKLQKSSSAAYILEQGSTMLKSEREKLQFLKNQQLTE